MTVDGVRFTHPDTAQIGKHFLGTIAPAADGESITETYTGTLGPSVRAVVPVRDGTRVVALVAVGRTVEAVSRALTPQMLHRAGGGRGGARAGCGGSFLVSRWLRRTTRDLGPAELARRNEYYDAVLHAVREGMVLLDREGRVQLVNDEARRLLDLPDEAVGGPSTRWGCPWRSARRSPPVKCGPTRSTSPPSASSWSTSSRRAGTAVGSARSSPCATTPSCGRSSASWPPCAGSPTPSTPRPTRPPTSCTR